MKNCYVTFLLTMALKFILGSDINGVFGRLVKAVKGIECFIEEEGKSLGLGK